jgi:hypothetical protein
MMSSSPPIRVRNIADGDELRFAACGSNSFEKGDNSCFTSAKAICCAFSRDFGLTGDVAEDGNGRVENGGIFSNFESKMYGN